MGMGLERFQLAAAPTVVTGPSIPALTFDQLKASIFFNIMGGRAMPEGVDLNLDNFNLSSQTGMTCVAPGASWTGEDFLGNAFWSRISQDSESVPLEDKKLLRGLF